MNALLNRSLYVTDSKQRILSEYLFLEVMFLTTRPATFGLILLASRSS